MNIEDKLAKPDKTIGQHSNELIEQAKLLYKLGYIKSDDLYSDLLVSCLKHDNGKANSQFQKRILPVACVLCPAKHPRNLEYIPVYIRN